MKCENEECAREAGESGLCQNCENNLLAWQQQCSSPPVNSDEERLRFLANNAHDLPDLSGREAALVDDISQFGERELKAFERHLADTMMKRHKSRLAAIRRKE
jgi:hypothetical protein